jgi:hypothetical protein
MRGETQPGTRTSLKTADMHRSGSDLEWRYPVALGLYVALALLTWFTLDGGNIFIAGKPVDIRLIPLLILGGLALRTVLARHADRIRRSREESSASLKKG